MEDLFAEMAYDMKGIVPAEEFVEYDTEADPPPPPEFNEDEALPNKNILHADTGVQATLKTLNGHLQNLRSPDGSKMNPAKTCQDIKLCYPQKKSGGETVLFQSLFFGFSVKIRRRWQCFHIHWLHTLVCIDHDMDLAPWWAHFDL